MMLRTIVFIILLLEVFYTAAQPAIHRSVTFGGSDYDWCQAFINSSDGGYYLIGTTRSYDGNVTGNHGEFDIWVVKIDSALNLRSQKSFGGSDWEFGFSGDLTFDGGCVVAGSTESGDGDVQGLHGKSDFWVIKIDAAGGLQWQKCFGGKKDDYAASVRQTSDSGFIVAGSSYSADGDVTGNHGSSDFWVIKLDKGGNLQWQKSLGGSKSDEASIVLQTSDGGYLVGGSTESDDGDVTGYHQGVDPDHPPYDFWVVKLDGSGTLKWQKCYGGSEDDVLNSIASAIDGGYVAAGYSESSDGDLTGNHGWTDYWIIKTDSVGKLQWQRNFGGTSSDFATCIKQTQDKGYIVGGYTESSNGDVTGKHELYYYFYDGWLVKLDSSGTLRWQKCYGGTYDDEIYSVHQFNDGKYVFSGYSQSHDYDVSENKGWDDYWFAELSEIIVKINNATCNQSNGSAKALPGPGIPPFTYLWSTGQTTDSIHNLSPGYYSVTITDSAGHVSDGSFSVINDNLQGSIIGKDASCWFCTDGSVTLLPFGGSGRYIYSWEGFPDDTTSTLSGLGRGTYHGCVNDRTGCKYCASYLVNSPVGIEETNPGITEIRVIPNPVFQTAAIRFQLEEPESLTISLFDLTGKEVNQIAKGIFAAGENSVTLDISEPHLSTGIYVLQIRGKSAIARAKIAVIQ